ncbi:hypothetical protein LTR84_006818 [Exophiala bonariae]|uniref:ATP synthase subunit K, mitochondrial n=1 Tax=Exophiala bonariae TaxID=1690606 RepID=A0AAV9N162_9EURO|nr:hypothetical protein LTR84_006818 [Exophiala bonariae]
MVVMYNVFGRQIGSHWLAMATLGTTFAVPYLMTRGGKPTPQAAPPINAGSKDEAKFIEEFLQEFEKGEKAK